MVELSLATGRRVDELLELPDEELATLVDVIEELVDRGR